MAWQQQNQLNSPVAQPTTSSSCSGGDLATNDCKPSLKPAMGASPIVQLHCKCTCHISSYDNNGHTSDIKVTLPPQPVTDSTPNCTTNDTCCSVINGTSSTPLGHIPTKSVVTSCKTESGASTTTVKVCCEDKSDSQSDDFKETKKRFRMPTSTNKLSVSHESLPSAHKLMLPSFLPHALSFSLPPTHTISFTLFHPPSPQRRRDKNLVVLNT